MSSTPDLPLAHCAVAITRPADQAGELAELISKAGGEAVLFPLLEIRPVDDLDAFDHLVARLETFDWAFFISSNAVEHAMPRLLARRSLPPRLRWVAIGPTTAACLRDYGISNVLTPRGRYDSESLLDLPEMQSMAGQRCVIFRGIGGRELLADTLRARGAEVEFAECYQRVNPNADTGKLHRLWQNGRLHAIVVTSSEALRNLMAAAGDEPGWLGKVPLFVNHERIAASARQLGLQAYVAQVPGDAGLLAAMTQWRKNTKPPDQ